MIVRIIAAIALALVAIFFAIMSAISEIRSGEEGVNLAASIIAIIAAFISGLLL